MATDFKRYSETWHQDLPLVSLLSERTGSPSPLFRTARSLGGLVGDSPGGFWSFEPGLPPGYDLQELHLLNCGYRMVSLEEEDLLLLQVRPGLFLGNFPVSAVPELFCSHQAVKEEGSRSTLLTGDSVVELTQELRENRRLVRLRIRPAGDPPSESGPEPDVRELWAALWKERKRWLSRMGAEERPVMFDLALEVLEAGLRPPAPPFSGDWLNSGTAPGIRIQDLPGLLPALTRMAPEAAGKLLNTLLSVPRLDNGAFPAFSPLKNTPEEPDAGRPAWPMLSIAVQTARAGEAPLAVPPGLLPALREHIQAWVAISDDGGSLPVWPDPDGAFTPEIVDEGLELFDLAALLIAEIDAYRHLSGDASAFESERSRWRAEVLGTHWSATRGVFLDRTRGGQPAKRMTLGTLLPLLWSDLPGDHRRALLRSLAQSKGLRSPKGLLQWEPRDGDPAPAPVRTLSQHLLMRPLLADAPQDVRSLVGLSWAQALDDHARHDRGFPADWEEPARGWDLLTAAFCLRFAPLHAKADLQLGQYPAWVRFLERQRSSIIGTLSTLAVVIPLMLGLFFALRPDYSQQQEQSVAGHGETMIALGRFADAEAVFTDLLSRTRRPTFHLNYYAQRGQVRARLNNFEGAREDLLRAVELDQDLIRPSAHWNLAQVLWRMGDLDAARAALEEFAEIFEEGYPQLGRNARNALALIDLGHNPFASPSWTN